MTESVCRTSQPGQSPLSLIAARIVEESLKNDVELTRLAALAQSDPAFGVRLLSTVNSAAFGLPHRVADLRQAVSLLGTRGIRNLGLSLALSDMVPTKGAGILLAQCTRRAAAARAIARSARLGDPEEAFSMGLFLEVGLLARARDDLAGVVALARRPARHRPLFERADGIRPHPEAGADLAASFRLPEALVEAIRTHHAPTMPEPPAARVAWMAERLAGAFESSGTTAGAAEVRASLEKLGLTKTDAAQLVAGFPDEFAKAAAFLDRELEPQRSLEDLGSSAQQALVDLNLEYEAVMRRMEELMVENERVATELREANAKLSELAATDSLTGLSNNRAFREALGRELARAQRAGTPVAVIMMDIDFFKRVNDTHGHAAGDEVLLSVAQSLRGALRAGDLAARYGGEEFVLLLPGTLLAGACVVGERLRHAIETSPVELNDGTQLAVTASFGCALARGTSDASGVLARADAALYAAKRGGRNRVAVEPFDAAEQAVA